MTTYLTIITTVLVLTQIVRVCQNAKQLSRYEDAESNYNLQIRVFRMLEKVLKGREESK